MVRGAWIIVVCACCVSLRGQPDRTAGLHPDIPKVWDDTAMATLEVPLANPTASAKHVSGDYYYKIPVRPIYKMYPVYTPDREPNGYMDWLRQLEPVIIWDDKGHSPPLATESDWIKAGGMVFDAPVVFGPRAGYTIQEVRDPAWYRKSGVPVTRDGIMPFFYYTVREKGTVEVAAFGCGTCHTRVMPDGAVLKGPQGNFPVDRTFAEVFRRGPLDFVRTIQRTDYGAPWLTPDPLGGLDKLSQNDIALAFEAVPPGVDARFGTGTDSPPQIPDLVGVKGRRYLDHTGLQKHRSIADLMRYAAINQGEDLLSSYGGFIPSGGPQFSKLPDPSTQDRYSDEQLYALALYVYSLEPPKNPNKFDAVAAQGERIFKRQGCAGCHTPQLYTNNKLTLAEGFKPPPGANHEYDLMSISVGTDPKLALQTRRGTGYYKVPSLKGLWYRGMFGHSGWCATLEDWFDPRRTQDDYVSTGFKPYGTKTYTVKGHAFGLDLSADDKKALIAFLKTI
jgi:Di-haem oxidoreductase, putative peroxidase